MENVAKSVKVPFMEKVINFLKESKSELSRVVFPSKGEVINSTVVVIIAVIFVSIFLGVVDMGLSQLLSYIVTR